MSNLAFFAADTFGMTLFALDGGLQGEEIRTMLVGPWKVELTIKVQSEMFTPSYITFHVTVNRTIHLYVVQGMRETVVAILNAAPPPKKTKIYEMHQRWPELKSLVVCVFQWSDSHQRWSQRAKDLVSW